MSTIKGKLRCRIDGGCMLRLGGGGTAKGVRGVMVRAGVMMVPQQA